MGTMNVLVMLNSGLGVDLGPDFLVYSDVGTIVYTVSLAELLIGIELTFEGTATIIIIESLGVCVNILPVAIDPSCTTSTTSTSTSTSTTTSSSTSSTTTTTTTLCIEVNYSIDEIGPATTTTTSTIPPSTTTTTSSSTTSTSSTTTTTTTIPPTTTTSTSTTTSTTTIEPTTTSTSTTAQPVETEIESLSIGIAGGASFRAPFYSKTLSRVEDYAQLITWTGIVTKIAFCLTQGTGSPVFDFRAYIYEGDIVGDGSTNTLLGTSTNVISSVGLGLTTNFFEFEFDNISIDGITSLVVMPTNITTLNSTNFPMIRCIDVAPDGKLKRRYVGLTWGYLTGLDAWLRVYGLV